MKEWYVEMRCDQCSELIGHYIDCGPRGSWICGSCYENEPEENDTECMVSKSVRCVGGDDFVTPCENMSVPGTDLCIGCRKDIEWLHAPLTKEEKVSIDRAIQEIKREPE